jgi:hypothetical protein
VGFWDAEGEYERSKKTRGVSRKKQLLVVLGQVEELEGWLVVMDGEGGG